MQLGYLSLTLQSSDAAEWMTCTMCSVGGPQPLVVMLMLSYALCRRAVLLQVDQVALEEGCSDSTNVAGPPTGTAWSPGPANSTGSGPVRQLKVTRRNHGVAAGLWPFGFAWKSSPDIVVS